jgi:hypothetical protein
MGEGEGSFEAESKVHGVRLMGKNSRKVEV